MSSIEIKCPYCAAPHRPTIDPSRMAGREILNCDPENGGCDRYYAFFWQNVINASTRGIDGEVT